MGYLKKTKQPFSLLFFALRCATCLEQILPCLGRRTCSGAVMNTFYHENSRQSLHWHFFAKLLYCIFRDDCTMYQMDFGFR